MENETLEILKTRRSYRKYKETEVADETIAAIMEAATFAPTGMGRQSPTIVLVKTKETQERLSKLNARVMGHDIDPFYGAPLLAIVFGNPNAAPTWFEDACLVAGNMMTAAHSLGVDSCYIYRAKETFESEEGRALMKEWGLDEGLVGVSNVIMGYGDDKRPEPAPRKEDYVKIV